MKILISQANNGAKMAVKIPLITKAKELKAPCLFPTSIAFPVPIAWALHPMAKPCACGLVILQSLSKLKPASAPNKPTAITTAADKDANPPISLATAIAIGLVTDLGTKESNKILSSVNNKATNKHKENNNPFGERIVKSPNTCRFCGKTTC